MYIKQVNLVQSSPVAFQSSVICKCSVCALLKVTGNTTSEIIEQFCLK